MLGTACGTGAAASKLPAGMRHARGRTAVMVALLLTHAHLRACMLRCTASGVLLHGPPGTGKTAIVRALAAECAAISSEAAAGGGAGGAAPSPVALFARKSTDCLGTYAGDAEQHLRLLFEMVRGLAGAGGAHSPQQRSDLRAWTCCPQPPDACSAALLLLLLPPGSPGCCVSPFHHLP